MVTVRDSTSPALEETLFWNRFLNIGNTATMKREGWNDRFGPIFLHVVFFMYMTGKNFVLFFYSDPLKKVVLSEVGAFSKNAVRTAFLACFFHFTNHATSPPCQKCCMYSIFGRPLQIIQTHNLSHARLFCAKCCTCSNFSRVIQPQPYLRCLMYATSDDNETLQSRLWKYWVALLQSNTSFGNSVLS